MSHRLTAVPPPEQPRRIWRVLQQLTLSSLMLAAVFPSVGAAGTDAPPPSLMETEVRSYFAKKEQEARTIARAEGKKMAPEVWPFFAAGGKGNWHSVTNLYLQMAKRSYQFDNSIVDDLLSSQVWNPINAAYRAYEQLTFGAPAYALRYAKEITNSLPPGSILMSGTDTGYFLVPFLCQIRKAGPSLFAISPNNLADGLSLGHLRRTYGGQIYVPTTEDSQRAFTDYVEDAQRRLKSGQLKPGENVTYTNNHLAFSGTVCVMEINARLAKIIFDQNPDREFYTDIGLPIDWMNPHLVPHGTFFKLERKTVEQLPDEVLRRDRDYWNAVVAETLGPWLKPTTTVQEICDFAMKVYLRHDFDGFRGNPRYVRTLKGWKELPSQRSTCKTVAKQRAEAARLYWWRASQAREAAERKRMSEEADFAFRQALALCPTLPETVFPFVNVLTSQNRLSEAAFVAGIAETLDPENPTLIDLNRQLRELLKTKPKRDKP